MIDITTQLLHFIDPDCLEFDAEITRQAPLPGGRFAVALDRTYFYPTGGGQEHDLGRLGEAQVLDVYKDEEAGWTTHVVDRQLPDGAVHGVIDGERRRRHRQHHSAQHLLSGCFVEALGRETLSANINGETASTLDLEGPEPGKEALLQVETLANRRIWEDRPVKTYFISPERLAEIPLRKPPKVTSDIRIVEIDGLDYSPCGGTHVQRTGAIGVVKITRVEKVKDKTRVHFVAGERAVALFQAAYDVASGLALELTVGMNDLSEAVRRLAEQAKTAQRELSRLQAEMLAVEAERLYTAAENNNGRRLVLAALGERSMNDLRALAKALGARPGCVALLAGEENGHVSLAAACAPDAGLHAGELLRRYIPLINGRGGGDTTLAQGGGAASHAVVQRLLDQARNDLR
jgi:alanyl-tRNA synthetase